MGRAMVISDSSDDDSSSDADGDTRYKDLLADCFSKYARGGIEVSFRIVPLKRRASDKKQIGAKKRRSGTKVSKEPKWKCGMCGLSYSNKANLARHEKKAHFESQEKDKTKWKCQECGSCYSNKANLDRHKKKAHPPKSPETDKSNLTECSLCNTNYSNLYKHYGEHHSIDCVEDLLFDNGRVPVSSAGPDTEDGKAPWFLIQKQKATQHSNALKCRLCEIDIVFPNKNLLKHHYITDHKVDTDYLENVGHLFRMEKGAHLISDSKDRKRKSVPKNDTDGTADNGTSSLNDCHLCGKNFNQLCKHYGEMHNINDVEDMLFENGSVLIISSANTENGKAAWFLEQKKIAKQRLNNRKCRLCTSETEFDTLELLEHHYAAPPSNGGHHVHPDHVWKIGVMFRKEKKAHLKENSDSSGRSKRASDETAEGDTTVNKSREKVDANMKSKVTQPENIQKMGLITYICNCGVATDTYDASVKHAQTHFLRDYAPTTKICPRCDLTFEDAWFEDHVSRHGNKEDDPALQTIKYDHTTLLSDEWFDMFSVFSDTAHAENIKALSLYKHSRRVKMYWNVGESGVPLYQCGTCELFVDPAKIENHIGACSSDELQRHYCSKCDISFSTANALKKHEVDHIATFRIVTFNKKHDVQLNKALMQHQRPSQEESQESNDDEENRENPKRLKRNDYGVMKFCYKCQRSVNNFDAHNAAHKTEAKKRIDAIPREDNISKSIGEDSARQEIGREKQVSSGDNCRMDTDANEKDVQKPSNFEVSKDGTNRMEIDSGDIVTVWDSDNDSDGNQESFTTVETQAQINERTKDYERNDMERVSNVSGKDTPGEENDDDTSEVVDFIDVQDEILTDKSKDLVIDNTSQADIQAEVIRVQTEKVVNETQKKDKKTLKNKNNLENVCSAEDENNQDTNEMNSGSVELYLRQDGANENNTQELDANKNAELQSTQELLETLEGTENKEDSIQEDNASTNHEVTQKPVTRDISYLLPLIRQLAKYLETKKQ